MSEKNLQVVLASRPAGAADESNFRLVESAVPAPRDGEILVRVDWLSLDPYMRGRMNEGKSYAARVELGEVMVGGTVGTVVASRHGKFAEGDKVLGTLGWQRFAVSDGKGLVKLPDPRLPETVWLGAAGMPGHHGVDGSRADRHAESRARRWSSPPRAGPWGAWRASSRRSPAAAPWASPAVQPSATTW